MKKFWITLVVLTLAAALGACTPATTPEVTPPVDSAPAPDSAPVTDTAQPKDSEEPQEEASTQTTADKLMVTDAAMYRGTITAIEDGNEGKLFTLTQAAGTDFGAPALQFLFNTDTRLSFEAEKLVKGAYLEVYYGMAPGQKLNSTEVQTAIAANLYPDAAMVVFNGTLKAVTPNTEREGQGQLVMEELETGQEVVFNYSDDGTQFYLNKEELQAGDKLNIFHKGIFTMSLPPQGIPLEVRTYVEPIAK